jgi:hypothetical protein
VPLLLFLEGDMSMESGCGSLDGAERGFSELIPVFTAWQKSRANASVVA